MPRLREVRRDDAHPFARSVYKSLFGERDPLSEPGTDTGTKGNWWTVFALVPDAFDHAVAGFQFYRGKRKLDPKLRELSQTRVGWARGSQFVYSQHCKASRSVGLSEDKIAAIAYWQVAACYDEIERAILAYTDSLVFDGGRVADGVFDTLKKHLSDEEILELTYVIGMYDMHAVISRALRLEFDDVDERIVEVPSPSGGPVDVMRMVDQDRK
jgi:alkylhydroperoxidase family enzyme